MVTPPKGIVSVLQTPFDAEGALDCSSLDRLVEDAIASGVNGFLSPAVASEVEFLTGAERIEIVQRVAAAARGRVPLIAGASSDDPATCQRLAHEAERAGAWGYLVAVPQALYGHPDSIVSFFRAAVQGNSLPCIIQDLQWSGPGLDLNTIARLRDAVPTLAGFKIETVPAGPKYTAVRAQMGPSFYIAGGWAIPQFIEALDRGVDAMIPEASMVRVYAAIDRAYRSGDRKRAVDLFRALLPVLVFANQEIGISIAFFKRLLVRRGIFATAHMRQPGVAWDAHTERIANELTEYYLLLSDSIL